MLKTLLQSALKLAGQMAMPFFYSDSSTVVSFSFGQTVKTVAPYDSYATVRVFVNSANTEAQIYAVGKFLFSNIRLSTNTSINTTIPVRKGDEIELQMTTDNWTTVQITFWKIRGVSDLVP